MRLSQRCGHSTKIFWRRRSQLEVVCLVLRPPSTIGCLASPGVSTSSKHLQVSWRIPLPSLMLQQLRTEATSVRLVTDLSNGTRELPSTSCDIMQGRTRDEGVL